MAKLQAEFDEAKAKEVELLNNYTDSDRKCKRAKSLIEKLSNESKSWKVSLEKNKADKLNLVGDIIISSGVIAYLGVFSYDYRLEAINNWVSLMKSFSIKSTDKFSLRGVLGNEVLI